MHESSLSPGEQLQGTFSLEHLPHAPQRECSANALGPHQGPPLASHPSASGTLVVLGDPETLWLR